MKQGRERQSERVMSSASALQLTSAEDPQGSQAAHALGLSPEGIRVGCSLPAPLSRGQWPPRGCLHLCTLGCGAGTAGILRPGAREAPDRRQELGEGPTGDT